MYAVYIWDDELGWDQVIGLALKTTEVEANQTAVKRSLVNARYIYAVIEDGQSMPYTIFWQGTAFATAPAEGAE